MILVFFFISGKLKHTIVYKSVSCNLFVNVLCSSSCKQALWERVTEVHRTRAWT